MAETTMQCIKLSQQTTGPSHKCLQLIISGWLLKEGLVTIETLAKAMTNYWSRMSNQPFRMHTYCSS